MQQFNFKFLLVKQICKEFAMTVPATRKALKACGIMNDDGTPSKEGYATEGLLHTGKVYYRWNAMVVREAFSMSGYDADELSKASFILNRHQAEDKLDKAFFEMGNVAGLADHEDNETVEVSWAYGIYESAEFNDMHAIGGPAAILHLTTSDQCNEFLKKLSAVSDRYKKACLSTCKSNDQKDQVEFHYKVIKKISEWVLLQFFR